MVLRSDQEGLESLPLKLMIIALVAAMTIVPASEALNSLRNRDFVNRVELQLDHLITTAQILAASGPYGTRTLNLDFSNEGSLTFERIIIGDVRGPNMSSIRVEFSNGASMIRSCDDPPIWLRTDDGRGLLIEAPISEIRISSQLDGELEYILVEGS